MNRYLGDPPGARKVYPLPDMEPVELDDFPLCVMSGVAAQVAREEGRSE
ncbi:hypothetical protein AB0O20_11850 [Streptomyces kronopolitis]